ncbi:Hypothetical predicted protein [Octopus vulgaris]|uniref:Uncharacterized protein n=1 Tax=Octopus vulgaris TaxID=6645 RepID=A0AA36ARY7_OCTVU|nr:Hypothetical predicted protein [Octopus vulgaris]
MENSSRGEKQLHQYQRGHKPRSQNEMHPFWKTYALNEMSVLLHSCSFLTDKYYLQIEKRVHCILGFSSSDM